MHPLVMDAMSGARLTQVGPAQEVGIGDIVEHPRYGRGRLAAIYRNGSEWMVRFDSSLRFRRPRHEFNGQQERPLSLSPWPVSPEVAPAITPMPRSRFEARQLLEALRMGIAPAQHIQELTIGLAEERSHLSVGLTEAHQHGGAAYAVVGDYGFGKSHIVELATQEALTRNFLVAATSLDLQELPAHRAFDIYAGLMRNLRYPDSDEPGLATLLEKAGEMPTLSAQLRELTPVEHDPLAVTLAALGNTSSSRQHAAWTAWLMGGRRVKAMNRAMPRGIKFPSLYRIGQNARQITYLLSGISVLARLAGYSGLAVLIDEAESYSLLSSAQRPKAGLFFSAMIAAAQGERGSKVRAESLPQHRWRDYPLGYTGRQSLFFLFTVTHSDKRMPLEEWLAPEQILALDPHHTPQEIGHFLQQVMTYHALAYDYTPGERQGQVRRGAAEHLALGMRAGRLSIRGVVRLAVELFDLLYLYPDYDAATLLDEVRSQMR
jgi:hypothetical protein